MDSEGVSARRRGYDHIQTPRNRRIEAGQIQNACHFVAEMAARRRYSCPTGVGNLCPVCLGLQIVNVNADYDWSMMIQIERRPACSNYQLFTTGNIADDKKLAEIRKEVVAFSNRFELP